MISNTAKYRLKNPEYREKEREKDRETSNQRYKEDENYREKRKQISLAYYYKKKELKQNQAI